MNRLTFINFTFQKKICQQDSNLHMASLDVDSLFTNIPLDKIIDTMMAASTMATRILLTFQIMIFVICLT